MPVPLNGLMKRGMETAVALAGATGVALAYVPGRAGEPRVEAVRQRAAIARDDHWYGKSYAMMRVMAGDLSQVDQLAKGALPTHAGDPVLGDFPEIDPDLGPYGVQNHLLVDSRINVMGIVFTDPEFLFEHPSPLFKQVNSAYLRQRWKAGDWSTEFFSAGMDVQAVGIGFVELGIRKGALTVAHRPVLDMLWDPVYRSPQDWRYVFCRRRLDLGDAIEKYGHLYTPDELAQMARPMASASQAGGSGRTGAPSIMVVHEWSYWTENDHCVFLGDVASAEPIYLDREMAYRRGKVGPNPYGCIPFVPWIESWAPHVKRPIGRVETSWRMAVMLMLYETYIREILMKGTPINILSTLGLQPDQIEGIKKANKNGLSSLERVITVDGVANAAEVMHRVPAADVPQSLLWAKNDQERLMNASSGVMDTQRGQALAGDTTATEVRSLNSQQGVQARHTRKQFARFLEGLAGKARRMGALFDRLGDILQLPDSQFDTSRLPLAPMLAEPCNVGVEENTLQHLSPDELMQRRLVEFQSIDMQGITLGVVDPFKAVAAVYQDIGRRDPTSRMYSPEEYAQRKQQEAWAAAGGEGEAPAMPEGAGKGAKAATKKPAKKEKDDDAR